MFRQKHPSSSIRVGRTDSGTKHGQGFGRVLSDRRIHAADLSCNTELRMQEDLKSIQPVKGHTDLQQFCLPALYHEHWPVQLYNVS
jgi:hypothetical protein